MNKTPNNKTIELLSVCQLKIALAKVSKCHPNINENDKTPSWDGNIEVYNNDNKKKGNLDGTVPVQVKGKWCEDICNDSITFPIEVTDLINYKNGGGVMYFVILCNTTQHKIYYASLLPIDIDSILRNKITQKNISVGLDILPNAEREIYLILKNFLYHSKRQTQIDLNIQKHFFSHELKNSIFSFGYGACPYPQKDDIKEYMLTHPTYIYAKPKGFNVDVVIQKVFFNSMDEEIFSPIIIDGEILYEKVIVQTLPHKKRILKIGKSISLHLDDGEFNFELASDIKTRIKDLKIAIKLLHNQPIFEKEFFIIEFVDVDKICEEYEKHLEILLRIQEVLDLFLVKKNLEINNISEEDIQKLLALVHMVLYNEPTQCSFNGKEGVGYLTISNIKLLVVCKRVDESRYMIYNIFSEENTICRVRLSNGDEKDISIYMRILKREQLKMIDNLDLNAVVKSIKSIEHSYFYDTEVNNYVLELIAAYDDIHNCELLNAADDLLSFIILEDIEAKSNEVYFINKMQVKKRLQCLSKKDKNDLLKLKGIYSEDNILIICINILLESYGEAQLLYENLSVEDKKEFDKFPINNIWIKKNRI